jgi:hypothetical protein
MKIIGGASLIGILVLISIIIAVAVTGKTPECEVLMGPF